MKKLLLLITLTATFLLPGFLQPVATFAAAPCGQADNSAKGQVLQGIGAASTDCNGAGVTSTIQAIVSILSLIAGIVAVIMVIVAAFRYITSGGDGNKVSSAKNALTYALIGLVVAALAQFLVHFVLNSATNAANTTSSSNNPSTSSTCIAGRPC